MVCRIGESKGEVMKCDICVRFSCKFSFKNYFFFFQAEDGIRGAQESRGLGDVYKRQLWWPVRRSMLLTPFFSTRCLQTLIICSSVRCFL